MDDVEWYLQRQLTKNMKGELRRFVMPLRTIIKLNTATFWTCPRMGFPLSITRISPHTFQRENKQSCRGMKNTLFAQHTHKWSVSLFSVFHFMEETPKRLWISKDLRKKVYPVWKKWVEVNASEPSVPSKLILCPTAIKMTLSERWPRRCYMESYKPLSYIALYLSSEVSYF